MKASVGSAVFVRNHDMGASSLKRIRRVHAVLPSHLLNVISAGSASHMSWSRPQLSLNELTLKPGLCASTRYPATCLVLHSQRAPNKRRSASARMTALVAWDLT